MSKWETLNTAELLQRRAQMEQTVSGNAGAFAVPLGAGPLRAVMPGAQDDYDIPDEYRGIFDLHYSEYEDD